ncbi:metallophosphoesterase family protein, partial [Streptococcus pseudopneumoniae]|uniref:metallophosphoesterase family protein n=1 Tax=Streptococcus pseudopneumoniae TaxID=257758 RepID=UPI00110C1F5C
ATDGRSISNVANISISVTAAAAPPPGFKVAFIGDTGATSFTREVLELIRDEGADLILVQGDLGYDESNPNSPLAWDNLVSSVLGSDFPLFASIGNHDLTRWATYEQLLVDRLTRVSGATCVGEYGVNSACNYRGLFFILSGAGTSGADHATFIEDQLGQDNSIWRICSWHKNQTA